MDILFTQPCISNHFETREQDRLSKRYNPTSQVRVIPPEDVSPPVQCENNPTGSNGHVVYGDVTYPIPSDRNPQPRDEASSVDNSPVEGGGSEQSSAEENLVLWPRGHLTSGGRCNAQLSPCPVCLGETTHRVTVPRANGNGRGSWRQAQQTGNPARPRRRAQQTGNQAGRHRLARQTGNPAGRRRRARQTGNPAGRRRLARQTGNPAGRRRRARQTGNPAGRRRLAGQTGNPAGRRRRAQQTGNPAGCRRQAQPSRNQTRNQHPQSIWSLIRRGAEALVRRAAEALVHRAAAALWTYVAEGRWVTVTEQQPHLLL